MTLIRQAWLRPGRLLFVVILLAAGLRLWGLAHLPPGLCYDEAFNGLDARRVLSGEALPLYFPANDGREPLYIYLQVLSLALFGPTAWALRLVSALAGVLTVPAVYFAARSLFAPSAVGAGDLSWERRRGEWLALIAAAGIAVSYWHLSVSRLGFRAILLPLVSALAIGCFWRAWAGGRRRDYAWAGGLLGLAFYTYLAARVLPLVVALFVLVELAGDLLGKRGDVRKLWMGRLAGLGIMVAVAALVLLPLAVNMAANPELITSRTAGLSILTIPPEVMPGTPLQRLGHNLLALAGNFYHQGDLNPRHNLPGRPVNDPFLALLFTFGIFAVLTGIRGARSRLLLLWLGVMALPTLLSHEAPHTLRAVGMLPPLALCYASGAGAAGDVAARLRAAGRPPALGLALAGVVLISGVWTAADYFGRWARLPSLGEAFAVDVQRAAVEVAHRMDEEPLLVASQLFLQPQMGYALGTISFMETMPADLPATLHALVEEGDGGESSLRRSAYLVWGASGRANAAWVETAEPTEARLDAPTTLAYPHEPPAWPKARAGVWSGELKSKQIRNPLNVTFANGMRLLGYEIEPDVLPPHELGGAFQLRLFWECAPAVVGGCNLYENSFDVFVHLLLEDSVWRDANMAIDNYHLWHVQAGGVAEDVRILPTSADMPAGRAHFEVGLFRYDPLRGAWGQERIPITDDAGRPVADQVTLGGVMVGQSPPRAELTDLTPADVLFDARIELVGWRWERDPEQPGRLMLHLGWRAAGRPSSDYTAFVHLLDAGGAILAQHDHPPGGPENPTHLWVPGETVRSTFVLEPAPAAGTLGLSLRLGLYEPTSGERLPLSAGDDDGTNGRRVEAGERVLIIPWRDQ